MPYAHDSPPSLEAKLVVLGSQGVGKTSLVHRYVKNAFVNKLPSTVGASFLTTRAHDAESDISIRLQIWDTAGQERYRSITRLYYRGAHAAILCYDITNEKSFEDMGVWLKELREYCGPETIIHFVGTKTDVVAAEPEKQQVSFEQCMEFVAKQMYSDGSAISTPGIVGQGHDIPVSTFSPPSSSGRGTIITSPISNRSSGFWGADHLSNCHEVSAKDGEGIEEIFRVITRELVDQHLRRQETQQRALATPGSRGRTPGVDGSGHAQSYFEHPGSNGNGAFRVGGSADGKRRSWLGFPTPLVDVPEETNEMVTNGMKKKRCC